jgi:hypothetical protein
VRALQQHDVTPLGGPALSIFDPAGVDIADRHPGQAGHFAGVGRQDAAGGQPAGPVGQLCQEVQRIGVHHDQPRPLILRQASTRKEHFNEALSILGARQPRTHRQRIVIVRVVQQFRRTRCGVYTLRPGQGQPGHFGQHAGQRRVQG